MTLSECANKARAVGKSMVAKRGNKLVLFRRQSGEWRVLFKLDWAYAYRQGVRLTIEEWAANDWVLEFP